MEKRIMSVQWSASGLPAGLSFDTATGTFSGTPSEAGNYTVPITVKTNYGEDSKDVKINVIKTVTEDTNAYPVYAIGQYAAKWSENAEPDKYGFRKLNMPNAYRLLPMNVGFVADVGNGTSYVCTNWSKYLGYTTTELKLNVSTKLPIDNIKDISYGRAVTNSGTYYYHLFLLNDNRLIIKKCSVNSSATTTIEVDNVLKIHQDYGDYGAYLKNDENKIIVIDKVATYNVNVENSEKIKTIVCPYGEAIYLTKDGKVYGRLTSTLPSIGSEIGTIKQIFPVFINKNTYSGKGLFILNNRGELYAFGDTDPQTLGLPSSTSTSSTQYLSTFVKVGNFDVKQIRHFNSFVFLLTQDGKLYHSGSTITDITGNHLNGFEQIFPEYRFNNISISSDKTLIVTIKPTGVQT